MSLIRNITKGLRSLLRKERVNQELSEELAAYLEMAAEEKMKGGMSRKGALRAVRLERGSLEVSKEIVRSGGWESIVDTLWRDVRFGARTLRKSPGFTIVAVVTLALGIGANTAIFSIIEAVLLRPLPYRDPRHLVLFTDSQDPQNGAFLFKDIEAFKSQSRSFEDLAVYYRDSGFSRVTLTSGGEPESVQGAFVSANFFSLMGVGPVLGRVFTSEEEAQRVRVVVLSYGLWKRRFGGSQDAIGRVIQIDGADSEIIGVMAGTFQFPARDQQFWAPLTMNRYWDDQALQGPVDPGHTRYFYERWQAVGRLAPNVTIAQAQTEVSAVFRRTEPDFENSGPGITLAPVRVTLAGHTRLALMVLFCAVSFVLLISCSNVANLVLARGATREREIAVRTALGAGGRRLLQQLLTESAVLSASGGGLGLLLASLSMHLLIAMAPADIPRLEQAGVDGGTLAFTVAISLLAAGIFGAVPAWKALRSDPGDALRTGVRSGPSLTRTRSVLVVAEIALAVVLLAGAGLLIRSFLAVEAVDLGFQPEHVLTMHITMPVGAPQSQVLTLHDEVLEQVAALPGVKAVGAISDLFELGDMRNLGLRAIDGRAAEPRHKWTPLIWKSVSGDYFQAMGAALLRGRSFSDHDNANSPLVAVIDENMVSRYWPNEDPLGKRFKGQDPRGRNDDWVAVIGVVGNMRRNGLERQPVPHVFEWYKQAASAPPDLVVRTASDPRSVAVSLRALVRGLDRTAILSPVTTMQEKLSEQLSLRRFQTSLLGLFSGIAMMLAVVGIFGVMHYSVAQGAHELGIRAALGAKPRDALRLVLRQAANLAFWGIAIGIPVALALTRFMAILLFGVGPTDIFTFVVVPVLLALVALLASYLPARRATRVDPMVALRYE